MSSINLGAIQIKVALKCHVLFEWPLTCASTAVASLSALGVWYFDQSNLIFEGLNGVLFNLPG